MNNSNTKACSTALGATTVVVFCFILWANGRDTVGEAQREEEGGEEKEEEQKQYRGSLERLCGSAVFCIWAAEILMTRRVWGKPIPLIQSVGSDSKQGQLKKSILKCDFKEAAAKPEGPSVFGIAPFTDGLQQQSVWALCRRSHSHVSARRGFSAFVCSVLLSFVVRLPRAEAKRRVCVRS